MAGGGDGAVGRQTIFRADGSRKTIQGIDGCPVDIGDRLVLETPGGGGYGEPARTTHQVSAAAGDAQHPAALSHIGVLDVQSSTAPRPSSRKRRSMQHLADLATKPGEKSGQDE
jgi:N-methylhydantoinase B/oxoprolinase/acetone carboxylase alpha subunit